MGNGLKPQIELLNEEKLTTEQKSKELEKYQYVLDDLNRITDKIDRHNDVSFEDTITQLVQQTVDYGRSAILFDDFVNPKKIMLYSLETWVLLKLTISQTLNPCSSDL